MTGTTISSAGLDLRRRKLLYRAWHRGLREADLLLGGFADRAIGGLDDCELDGFERLLEEDDAEILAWATGRAPIPPRHDTRIFGMIRQGYRASGGRFG